MSIRVRVKTRVSISYALGEGYCFGQGAMVAVAVVERVRSEHVTSALVMT